MIDESRLVALFRDLCMINAPSLRERECTAYVKQYLASHGLEILEDSAGSAIGGNGNNLIVWLRGNVADAPKIFLSAHFDTVEPTAGLEIVERDGVFYSQSDTILGADDKGGMAPAIEAVLAIKESGEEHGDVCLLLSVAEEIGLLGANALAIQDLDLDFGYVLDTGPPVGSFVTRTANHDKLDITITGKPAHSGKDPEKGINAIQVAATAIEGMKVGRIDPETTANLGTIEGGTATNVVCPFVKIKGEVRSTSLKSLEAQVDHMIQRFESAARQWGAEVQIEHKRAYAAYEVDMAHPVVQVAQTASRTLGFDPVLRTTLGGSDANVYNQKGVPCIVVATGMDKIHTHDEFISRKDLIDTAGLAVELIRGAAKVKPTQLP
ncbi:MAG TPA: M20/M25/M40 family metallo-hydrolase [Fimbriimonadaceae bacterium]|nr:M20/M25/M40 family metallo-hydrolase [Fimbriimonadaceae bacterium]